MKLDTASTTRNSFNVLRSPDGVLIHGPSCPRGILTFGHWVSDFTCACVTPAPARECSASVDAPAPRVGTRVPRDDQYQAGTRQFQSPAEPHSQLSMEVA